MPRYKRQLQEYSTDIYIYLFIYMDMYQSMKDTDSSIQKEERFEGPQETNPRWT
jgi:hypothetical protein